MLQTETETTTNKPELKLFHINIRGLRSKKLEIEHLLNKNDYDLVSINEHWMNDDELNIFSIDNYCISSYFSRQIMKGGGTLLLNQKNLIVDNVNTNIESTEQIFEYCTTSFIYNEEKTVIICIYRSPQSDLGAFLYDLEKLLRIICRKFRKAIVSGDFNVDLGKVNNEHTIRLLDVFASYNFRPLINEPTRYANMSASVIDNIFVNFVEEFRFKIVNTGLSDHQGIDLCLPCANLCEPKNNYSMVVRNFSPENESHFSLLLQQETWEEVYNELSTNGKFLNFFHTFSHYFNMCFPETVKKKNSKYINNKKFFDSDHSIQVLKNEVQYLYWLKINSNDDNINILYETKKKEYHKALCELKKIHYDSRILESKNPNQCVWNIIKEITGKTNKIQLPAIELEGETITDAAAMTELFNKTFATSFLNKQSGQKSNSMFTKQRRNVCTSFFLDPVDPEEINAVIKKISIKKSAGLDQIPCKILNKVAHLICNPLSDIINKSFSEGKFPCILKKSRVIPIHKKGNKKKLENYRPVAVPSVFSKIIEKVFKDRLLKYLVKISFFNKSQHGFLHNKSTETALFSHIDKILESLDKGEFTYGVYFDLTKAFNMMNHEVLFSKLVMVGVRGIGLQWVQSFLGNRSQSVEIRGPKDDIQNHRYQSKFVETPIGAPQGSILSPLLFIIFINDLADFVGNDNVSVAQFADDTSIMVHHKENNYAVQITNEAVDNMYSWCENNLLQLNISKTNFINYRNVRSKSNNNNFKINGSEIECVNNTKFLGVITEKHFDWSEHGEIIVSRVASANYAIYNLRRVLSQSSIMSFYYAYVHSRIAYGIIFWCTHTRTANRVFVMQKRIIRTICGVNQTEHCKPLFYRLKVMTVYSLYLYSIICFVYKNIDKFKTNSSVNNIKTRNSNDLLVPKHNTTLYEKGPYFMGVKVYNALPSDFKKIKNFSTFKDAIRKFFKLHPFYSIEEFLVHQKSGSCQIYNFNCLYCKGNVF